LIDVERLAWRVRVRIAREAALGRDLKAATGLLLLGQEVSGEG
jgi:hypothetical protein